MEGLMDFFYCLEYTLHVYLHTDVNIVPPFGDVVGCHLV